MSKRSEKIKELVTMDKLKAELGYAREELAKVTAERNALQLQKEQHFNNCHSGRILDLIAERDAARAERDREAGIWNEQHAHQHAVNTRLAAERDRLAALVGYAVEGFLHGDYRAKEQFRAALAAGQHRLCPHGYTTVLCDKGCAR